MKKETFLEKYPVFVLQIEKDKTAFQSVDPIIDHLKIKVEADPIATFIEVFDHYKHTTGLETGTIDPAIKAAKNIVFCFGEKLPDPRMLALRPRSIGVAEYEEHFVISFLEAPMQPMNKTMESWVKSLLDN